jgi:hypothetical protein
MASARRITGFADLLFPESAHLALARAAEVAQTDVEAEFPSAFAVEERRLQFSIDELASSIAIDGFRRLLEALVRDASAGEASLEVETGERWAGRARGEPAGADQSSGARGLAPQVSGASELDESETRPTQRTGLG